MISRIKPIFRWAGGKSWIVKYLHDFLPQKFSNYHEPFLGGGSVFFNLKPEGITFLSDNNSALINAYCVVRDSIEELISLLKKFRNERDEYYMIRETKFNNPIERAAQFIYLNRTCYNGLYRVNRMGKFNVPFGKTYYKTLFDFDGLRYASQLLQSAHICSADFEKSIRNVKKGDLVFLDPPYALPLNNGFINYNEKLFSWEDQLRLARFVKRLNELGAFFLLTNAKHPKIKTLFNTNCDVVTLHRTSAIGGKNAFRGKIEEYLFCNTGT